MNRAHLRSESIMYVRRNCLLLYVDNSVQMYYMAHYSAWKYHIFIKSIYIYICLWRLLNIYKLQRGECFHIERSPTPLGMKSTFPNGARIGNEIVSVDIKINRVFLHYVLANICIPP